MRKLIEWSMSANIAEGMRDDELTPIAQLVIDNFNQDWESMEDWRQITDNGIKLSKPAIHPRSTPWQNAANYKSNIMHISSIKFGDRASMEGLKDKNLFKMDIVGKDPNGEKKEKSDRISTYENAHINYKMDSWRETQETLYYILPSYGVAFKKVFYDTMEQKKCSKLIHYPNFAIHQGTDYLEDCRSFTEIHTFSLNEAHEKQRFGEWRECNLEVNSKNGQDGTNAEEDADSDEENPMRYLEQHCYLDLDNDGYEEPYIVTVHESTMNIVRIVADYSIDSIIIRNGNEVINLGDVEREAEELLDEIAETSEIVKIKRDMDVVKYGFIRSPDGAFLDIGYFYLQAAPTDMINTTSNQLVDGGTLANRQSGFLAKEFRKGKGNVSLAPGEWKQTDIPAIQLANAVQPLPIKEPSRTLLELNEISKGEIKEMSSLIDMDGLIKGNVPATTALVAVQEQLMPTSAIMNRIFRAQSREFEKLYKMTPVYCKDADYQDITGTDAKIEDDYDDTSNIKATAQKRMSTDVTRMLEAQAGLALTPNILEAGGNPIPIIKRNLELLESFDVEEIFPEMTEEQQQAQLLQMQENMQFQKQLQQLQIAKEQKAYSAFVAQENAANIKAKKELDSVDSENEKRDSETGLNIAKTAETMAKTEKTFAETEQIEKQ